MAWRGTVDGLLQGVGKTWQLALTRIDLRGLQMHGCCWGSCKLLNIHGMAIVGMAWISVCSLPGILFVSRGQSLARGLGLDGLGEREVDGVGWDRVA
jgi:hypothetical protein